MVLLAGPGPEGGGTRCLSPQSPTPPRSVQTRDDSADYEEYEDFSSLPDTRSIASDDSFYPPGGEEECGSVCAESVPGDVPEAATLLRAACANDVGLLRALVRRGPSSEEVRETDRNGRVSPDRVCVPSALLPCPHSRVTPILDLLPLRAPFPSFEAIGTPFAERAGAGPARLPTSSRTLYRPGIPEFSPEDEFSALEMC